jgi:NAD(P)H dehydrogenase (quinone)
MKIGIIVYSQTENTYSVAERIHEKLLADGHETKLEKVIPKGEGRPGIKNVEFESQPDVDDYDAVIFGSPVQAFSLAAPMNAYLNQISSLEDKQIACFVTKGLPFHRTGGNQAIGQMKKICQSKGGTIIGTGIVVWRGGREKEINELLDKFSVLLS